MLDASSKVYLCAVLSTGCYSWSHISDLSDVAGAARVRIEPESAPSRVLDHPSIEEVRTAAVEEHARVSVEKINGLAVGAIAGGATLSVVATAIPFIILALIPRPVPVLQGGTNPPP